MNSLNSKGFDVRGTTRVYGIFGDPVAHSLSPTMQNAAFREAGLDAVYVPFHVRAPDLAEAVAALRRLDIAGINVTVPHKEKVVGLLDEVDEGARLIGAVNTIVNHNSRLFGYNTDGIGLLRALSEELAFDPDGRRVLLLGAGGASRAAAVTLASAGAKWIGWINRNVDRAQKLADEMSPHFSGTTFAFFKWNFQEQKSFPEKALSGVDLVVNTTTLGLQGEQIDLPWHLLPPAGQVYDMVYTPGVTPLCRQAHRYGFQAADGLSMLAGQGEEAFSLWTGHKAPTGTMKKRLLAVTRDKE